jgi:hypothetical protein
MLKTAKNLYVSIETLLKSAVADQLTSRMSISSPRPSQKEPERAFALQKYLLLHSQHDALQKQLSQISTSGSSDRLRHASLSSYSSTSSSDSENGSPTSPTNPPRLSHRSGSESYLEPQHTLAERRASLPAVIEESIMTEIAEGELKLKNVNQQIKTTLTELLNCGSVREDQRYRMWVQTRLMDAERELKGSRIRNSGRRRSEDATEMF